MQAQTYTALTIRREDLIEEINTDGKHMSAERFEAITSELDEIDQHLALVVYDIFEEVM